jgi:hypothetical protein
MCLAPPAPRLRVGGRRKAHTNQMPRIPRSATNRCCPVATPRRTRTRFCCAALELSPDRHNPPSQAATSRAIGAAGLSRPSLNWGKSHMRSLRLGCAIGALMVASTAVYAQETTGTIRGDVFDSSGNPVANATVTILHQPSGSRSTSTTGADGSFNASGLRVGGPYQVTVAAPGLESVTETIPSIAIGVPQRVEVTLFSAGETITVTGSRQPADYARCRSNRRRRLGQPRHPRHRPPRSVRHHRPVEQPHHRDRRPERPPQPLLGRRRSVL